MPLVTAQGYDSRIVRIHGAIAAAIPVADAAKALRDDQDLEVRIGTSGGSDAGIASLGEGQVDMALSSKPVSQEERAASPSVVFTEIPMGAQAIALTVSRDVWESGVHSLTANQVRDLYEGKIKNWKEVGGPDIKVSIFMTAPGRGVWEMFAQWLYGAVKKAPVKPYPNVNTFEEARNAVEFTPGSFSQTPLPGIDNRIIFALGVKDDAGQVNDPTPKNLANGKYPLCRTLYMVVNDKPTLNVKVVVDYMLTDSGQECVKKALLIPLSDLKAK